MAAPEIVLSVSVLSIVLLAIVVLYRRFRRAAGDVPWVCQAAAAIALSLGALTAIAGVGHCMAVASVALSERVYGNLQVLWFTTGAMLVYTGAMNAALHRAIKLGQRSAIAVSIATTSLFLLYMLFHLPMPDNEETVRPMLGLWSLYLPWSVAAAVASRRKAGGTRLRDNSQLVDSLTS